MWRRHRHQLQEINRQFGYIIYQAGNYRFTLDQPKDKYIHPYITLITLKCECGKYKQIELKGHVEDLTPVPSAFLK